MKKLEIFEPAMCCATGLCGPSVDPELLRISTLLAALGEKGIVVGRYNLNSTPQAFAENETVKSLLKERGMEVLPVTLCAGEVVLTGRYPTNQELFTWLQVDAQALGLADAPASCCGAADTGRCCDTESVCTDDGAAQTGCCCADNSAAQTQASCCAEDGTTQTGCCCTSEEGEK